ncbi:MAG TPA: hypothetical protein VGR47_19055 [Terracidiphilus sp.]|nr:hypothetical protein [Terracidiphilus sp.]
MTFGSPNPVSPTPTLAFAGMAVVTGITAAFTGLAAALLTG